MKNIIIAILFLMTVGMCNTLIPSSIVNEIHRLENVKRHKIAYVSFSFDWPAIVEEYIFDENKDRYWWMKYKFNLYFQFLRLKETMENKDNNGAGCLIILVIISLIALGNMKDDHKKQTDELQDEIRQLRTELEHCRQKFG